MGDLLDAAPSLAGPENGTSLLKITYFKSLKILISWSKCICTRLYAEWNSLMVHLYCFESYRTETRHQGFYQAFSITDVHHCITSVKRWCLLLQVYWPESFDAGGANHLPEYLVKYSKRAHIYDEWVSEDTLMTIAKRKCSMFKREYPEPCNHLEPEWMIPERLVARRCNPSGPGWEVLVKWTGQKVRWVHLGGENYHNNIHHIISLIIWYHYSFCQMELVSVTTPTADCPIYRVAFC